MPLHCTATGKVLWPSERQMVESPLRRLTLDTVAAARLPTWKIQVSVRFRSDLAGNAP
jgi:hypothetical protein